MVVKTILVPTDFSTTAHNAAVYAVNLARELKAGIILIHAYHPPFQAMGTKGQPVNGDELKRNVIDRLNTEAASLRSISGVEIRCVATLGFAADKILEMEKESIITVMGMQGEGQHSGLFLGSVTTTILPLAKKAVLVIPEHARYKDPENVVFACDYDSSDNLTSLNSLKCFTNVFGSRIMVLNVRPENEPIIPEEEMPEFIGDKLESQTDCFFIQASGTVTGIKDFIKEHNADMVAIVPRERNLLARLFHKSVSRSIVIHAGVPVLALPHKCESEQGVSSCII